MDNKIKVTVKPEHFRQAEGYIFNCPLELALKEMFPKTEIWVGGTYVKINGEHMVNMLQEL